MIWKSFWLDTIVEGIVYFFRFKKFKIGGVEIEYSYLRSNKSIFLINVKYRLLGNFHTVIISQIEELSRAL